MPFDLEPNEEQRALQETLHAFSDEVLRPAARDCEAEKRTSQDILDKTYEIGVVAPVPEEQGGGGSLDPVTYCIVAEELAWGDPGIAFQLLGSGVAALVIGTAGSDEQRSKHLPRFAAGEPIHSFVAVGEKVAAGDLGSLDTLIEGDKASGEKYGVVDAQDAELDIVVGRDSKGELGALLLGGGVSYEVVRPEDKMGLEAAPTYVVAFDGTGEAFEPGPKLVSAIQWTKLLVGGIALGCARASFEHAAQYAMEREAFGKPIGAFQGVSFKIADMATEVDAARVGLWRAAWLLERGEATHGDIAEAVGQALATAVKCGDDGVQVLGGHGYIRDHPVEKWFRDAVTLSVFDAPDLAGDVVLSRALAGDSQSGG